MGTFGESIYPRTVADFARSTPATIGIPVQRVFFGSLVIIAILALGFATTHLIWLATGQRGQLGFRGLLNMDGEANLPAWFSVVQLFAAATLLTLIALVKTREADAYLRHWWGLAAGFFYMSADEGAQLHEMLNRPGKALHDMGGGAFVFSWVVFAIPVLVIIAFAYLRFLRALPTGTRRGFLLAAACFLAGTVGFEVFEGIYARASGLSGLDYDWATAGDFDAIYMVLVMMEETLEMIGVAIFVRELLVYIEKQFPPLTISVRR